MADTAKDRVIAERGALRDKITGLTLFLGGSQRAGLKAMPRNLLKSQLSVMSAYENILAMRLDTWED